MIDVVATRIAALSPDQIATRMDLATTTSKIFQDVGLQLHNLEKSGETEIEKGQSLYGQGKDGVVAVSMLLRIASELISGSADLISGGRHYAGSALIRQLVEVEYLSWAFEMNNEVSLQWLRSTHEDRKNFFTPAKLRKAAGERFRSVDYSYHCELGGHPVPGSWVLIHGDVAIAQLMLSDCLGHSGRIWDHIVGWAKDSPDGAAVLSKSEEMLNNYTHWKSVDVLTKLPPPPAILPDTW